MWRLCPYVVNGTLTGGDELMIKVAGIKRGTVIDHVTAGKGLWIFNKLNLASLGHPVVLLMNVQSSRLGRKDIIKIEDYTAVDTAMLGLIDAGITVNIIENEQVVTKTQVSLPQVVSGLFACGNPRCVSNSDHYVTPLFALYEAPSRAYLCEYCEEVTKVAWK